MEPNILVLERAFQLAKSGRFASLPELMRAIKSEGYALAFIEGPVLRRQLRELIASTRNRPKVPLCSRRG